MSGNTPTHEIFNVINGTPDSKSRWDKIGVAWGHEDGLGLNLSINYLPVDPSQLQLVIRRVKPRSPQ